MIIVIPDLLPAPLADQMVADLNQLPWHAGDTTDGEYAAEVKQNQELKESDHPLVKRYAQAILETALTNEKLRTTVFPSMGKVPQFNKYEGGGAYHRHSDSAFLGRPEIRTDFSVTVFLSDPEDYDGGELTMEYPDGTVRRLKEKKGTLVCYPSGVLHHVTPVTRGARVAAITWLQTAIRSPRQRDILASLVSLYTKVKEKEGLSDTYTELLSIHQNLLRMWAES